MEVGGHRHGPAAFTPRKDLVPTVQEAGQAPWLVWIGAENLAPTGIRSPDLPACSELLYQLNYPSSSDIPHTEHIVYAAAPRSSNLLQR
jgi:hypothetical protein